MLCDGNWHAVIHDTYCDNEEVNQIFDNMPTIDRSIRKERRIYPKPWHSRCSHSVLLLVELSFQMKLRQPLSLFLLAWKPRQVGFVASLDKPDTRIQDEGFGSGTHPNSFGYPAVPSGCFDVHRWREGSIRWYCIKDRFVCGMWGSHRTTVSRRIDRMYGHMKVG